jgi:hypothetical protein
MLRDYMAIMGIDHMQDSYYNRMMYSNLTNEMLLPHYCYVMTTLYDDLTKTNSLIKDYDKYVLEKDDALGESITVEMNIRPPVGSRLPS